MARKNKDQKKRIHRRNRELKVALDRVRCRRELLELERRIVAAELRYRYFK